MARIFFYFLFLRLGVLISIWVLNSPIPPSCTFAIPVLLGGLRNAFKMLLKYYVADEATTGVAALRRSSPTLIIKYCHTSVPIHRRYVKYAPENILHFSKIQYTTNIKRKYVLITRTV